jgi:hypothetical protein
MYCPQKMLYPYLPEPMRNQETFEWMLRWVESRNRTGESSRLR